MIEMLDCGHVEVGNKTHKCLLLRTSDRGLVMAGEGELEPANGTVTDTHLPELEQSLHKVSQQDRACSGWVMWLLTEAPNHGAGVLILPPICCGL